MACLIVVNFLTHIVEKEIDPLGDVYTREFLALEYIYNIMFTIELAINMYSQSCKAFWGCGWNRFDFFVVGIGIVSMFNVPLPGSFRMLRMFRAFRVFRLFRRVQSLNKIITALARAVPGVVNAFLLLAIVMCIYAILAVELFIKIGENCHEDDAILAPSNRGACFGEEYFGSFSKSLYSFFQVLTGESWSEAVARPVLWAHTDPWLSAGSAIFFVSFVLVTAFVLTNVVVAVLLDKMVDSCETQSDTCEIERATPENYCNFVSPTANGGLSGRLASIEGQLHQLTKFTLEMRADLDSTKQDIRTQIAEVLTAVNGLGRHKSSIL